MTKGIIFDFNGTLLFDEDLHISAWSDISVELTGNPITKEIMKTTYLGLTNDEMLIKLAPQLTQAQRDSYSLRKEAVYRQKVLEMPGGPKLVSGAVELFEYLKSQGVPFTIASASIKPNIDFFVETFELYKWMDPAKIIYDDGVHLTKQSMYEDAVKVLGIDEVIVFEDSRVGVNAASALPNSRIIVIEKFGPSGYYKNNEHVVQSACNYVECIETVKEFIKGE